MSKSCSLDFVSDSLLLRFFLSKENSVVYKVMAFAALFFLVPAVLIAVAATDRMLFLEGDAIGVLEDYFFLSFSFAVAPLTFFFLVVVIRRFGLFLDDLRVFTTLDARGQSETRKRTLTVVNSRGRAYWVVIAKYVVGIAALASNMYSIAGRADGWNGLARPVQFWLTFLYLTILTCFIANQLLVKYLQILWAQIRVTQELARQEVIVVRPMAPDKAGGLGSLGELSLGFTYFLIPFAAAELIHYYTWQVVTVGSAMGLVGLIPLLLIVFFVPLRAAHRAMIDTKRMTLDGICEKHLETYQVIIADLKSGKGYESIAPRRKMLDMLAEMYDKADKMPVWPFNLRILARVLSIALGPLAVVLLRSMIQLVLGEVLE